MFVSNHEPHPTEASIEELREEYRKDIDMHVTADDLIVDHIVPPADLRRELIARLAVYETKHLPLPSKGHSTVI